MSDILHYYLDLLSGENEDRFGFHNVLNVMKQSRGGYVLNERFDGIDLRNEPLVGIHFSDEDGQNASSFRGCKVSRNCFLSGHSAPIESMEFIDDNTLVSRSANEVITWDIWSGMIFETHSEWSTLKIEKANYERSIICKKHFFNNKVAEFKIEIFIEYEGFYKTRFISHIPIYEVLKNRLIVTKGNAPAYRGFYLCDLKTKKGFPCDKFFRILEIGSCYVFCDKHELYVYNINNCHLKPVSLNVSIPARSYPIINKIKNTNCIHIRNRSFDNIRMHHIIVDVFSCKILLKTNMTIFTPFFVPELEGIWVMYADHTAIIRLKDGKVIRNFSEIKRMDYESPLHKKHPIVSISKSKKFLVVNNDYGIEVFSLKTGDLLRKLGGNTTLYNANVSCDRAYAFLNSSYISNHTNIVWDILNNHIINYNKKLPFDECIGFFSIDSAILAVYNQHGNIYADIAEPNNGRILYTVYFQKEINIHLDYSEKIVFVISDKIFYAYNKEGNIICSFNINDTLKSTPDIRFPKISKNLKFLAFSAYACPNSGIRVINLQNNQFKVIDHDCSYIFNVSDDGRFLTIAMSIDFTKGIITTGVLDIQEEKICEDSRRVIENDYILLNYLRHYHSQYFPKKELASDIYISNGWTIKVPSSPDNSTEALTYLVPNLYIGSCDFRGSAFDDETKEIIRQYNGIV